MRLLDLDPRWWADAGRHGQGLTFLCPHCRQVRLSVAFANPLDGGAPHPVRVEDQLRHVHGEAYTGNAGDPLLYDVPPCGPVWTRSGDTFEDLTVTPSVDASASGHWHGFITGGAIQ